MDLESYFEFVDEHAMRIIGARVGIETVVGDYCRGASSEKIVLWYPTLSLYLANRGRVEAYVEPVAVWDALSKNST